MRMYTIISGLFSFGALINCHIIHRLTSETRDFFIEGMWSCTVRNCDWAGETRFCLNDVATLNSLVFSCRMIASCSVRQLELKKCLFRGVPGMEGFWEAESTVQVL